MKITPIIGLEVHIQIKTMTKAFCGCSTDYFGHPPNSHVCPVCFGMPGALPVLNQELVRRAVLLGIALNADINRESFFERKNYFYPDSPKSYQITQHQKPIVQNGQLTISLPTGDKVIRIHEAHIEDDAAKSLHEATQTLVDFNKAGVPLIEIVSHPDMRAPEEVELYAYKLQQLVRYLNISDADIEKGSMRIEPTVNLEITTDDGQTHFTPLVEVKNIASMKFASQAVAYEIQRQEKQWLEDHEDKTDQNKTTRGYDSEQKITFLQRSKEEAADYRYFPEPDLPPLSLTVDYVNSLKQELPELPDAKIGRYQSLGISPIDSAILASDLSFSQKFDQVLASSQDPDFPKFLTNRFLGSAKSLIENLSDLNPNHFLEGFLAVKRGDASANVINDALNISLKTGQQLTYPKLSNNQAETKKFVETVIAQNPKAVADYKKNPGSIGFLLGQVMKNSQNTLNPQLVRQLLEELLK